ncbi:MAG: ribosome small subunit-dependent GTPase A [Gammaproteobacteria bacterium]
MARVVVRHRSSYRVHDGDTERDAALTPGTLQRLQAQDAEPVVGDWCLLRVYDAGSLWVEAVLPRRSLLARGSGHGTQPLVANVDTALLLMGLDGNFNPRRLERYLLLVRGADIAPVVVLSKADVCADAEPRVRQIRTLAGASVPVLCGDMRDPGLRDALAPWLQPGQTLVLLGSSGVGKSTLANTLLGDVRQATGAVSGADDRGRHTTVSRQLLLLPAGACLIDTPGLRELQLSGGEQLGDGAFEDIAALAQHCRYADCRHDGEPGCAVASAVAAERLAHYHKLARELAQLQRTPAHARAQRQKDKAQSRALRRFYRDEP